MNQLMDTIFAMTRFSQIIQTAEKACHVYIISLMYLGKYYWIKKQTFLI
jgi:hypothetical protein